MADNLKNLIPQLRSIIENFTKLTDEEWNMLVPHIKTKTLKKNEFLAENGKIANELGFVLKGTLRHFYLKDGIERTTYFYFENDLTGSYFSCVTNRPSTISIQALNDCTLLVFPYNILTNLYKTNMTWQEFGRLLAEFLVICTEERMKDLLILSPEERYINLLADDKNKYIEKIPQHLIANFLGITPVSLSRIRNRIIKKSK
jgi:CRP-like cAMP-binding protein